MDDRDGSEGVGAFLQSLFGLHGQTAVVTGGTSGLGAATGMALARAGAKVILVGRDGARGRGVVDGITAAGGHAELELADVGEPDDISALAERVLANHPRVDILVNAAGVYLGGKAEDVILADWNHVFAVNVTGSFLMCQAFGRGMVANGSGKIVNFASTDGLVGVPEQVAYCASKAAVAEMTRTLAVEWARHGVHVNCIAPGEFATPIIAHLLDQPDYKSWVTTAIPSGRVGQPNELVAAILLLVAPGSPLVVGHTLVVDGGRTVL